MKLRVMVCWLAGLSALLFAASLPAQQSSARGNERTPAAQQVPQMQLVLPFENSGGDPKLDWIGEGLAELCTERLAGDGRAAFPRGEWHAAVEKLGLPASTRFSRATMLKIAQEMDADFVVYGHYTSDGKTLNVTARVLRMSPLALSAPLAESGLLEELMETQARLAWQVLRQVDPLFPQSRSAYVRQFTLRRLDAFEHYIRGLLTPDEPQRMRLLREAARLEPEWPEPALAIGQAYLATRSCENALIWLSKVPPQSARGAEAGFSAGVCHLRRNDAARAEAAFLTLIGTRPSPDAFHNLAIAESRLGKWREAAAHWRRAQQLDPDEADYWFNSGVAAMRAGENAAAVRGFREALRRKDDDNEARALLVAVLERAGRITEAAQARDFCENDECSATPAVLAALGEVKTAAAKPDVPDAFARLDRIRTSLATSAWNPARRNGNHPAPGGSR